MIIILYYIFEIIFVDQIPSKILWTSFAHIVAVYNYLPYPVMRPICTYEL